MLIGYLVLLLPVVVLAIPSMRMPSHMVDMTYPLKAGDVMPIYPRHDKYKFKIRVRGDYPGTKIYSEFNTISLSDHTATHVDSPSHFARGKWRIHEIPLENCIAEAVVIDIKHKAKHQLDAMLDFDDIYDWEEEHGCIPHGAYVFMNSGWGEKWGNKSAYMGTDNTEDSSGLHFPGFDPDVCEWLVKRRQVKGIGSDTLSVDHGQRKDIGCHVKISDDNVLIFENVANIGLLPPLGATIYALPMNIYDGSGAPVRMVAMWNSATTVSVTTFLLIAGVVLSVLSVY